VGRKARLSSKAEGLQSELMRGNSTCNLDGAARSCTGQRESVLSALGRITLVLAALSIFAPNSSSGASAVPVAERYDAGHVRQVLKQVFRSTPSSILIGPGAAATLYSVAPAKLHDYSLSVLVFRRRSDADYEWRFERAIWISSGFAVAKLNNVLVKAGPVGARVGIKRPRFVMPRLVTLMVERLRQEG
jgi:hypothetical protein